MSTKIFRVSFLYVLYSKNIYSAIFLDQKFLGKTPECKIFVGIFTTVNIAAAKIPNRTFRITIFAGKNTTLPILKLGILGWAFRACIFPCAIFTDYSYFQIFARIPNFLAEKFKIFLRYFSAVNFFLPHNVSALKILTCNSRRKIHAGKKPERSLRKFSN